MSLPSGPSPRPSSLVLGEPDGPYFEMLERYGAATARPDESCARAVGYVRRSPAEVRGGLFTVEEQIETIRVHCDERGWTLANIIEDATPSMRAGARDPQPGLRGLVSRVLAGDAPASCVVAASLDRLAFRAAALGCLDGLRAGAVRVVAVADALDTGSPGGERAADMLSALAWREFWHENAERTPPWDTRNELIADLIDAPSRVLDLGAGAQTLSALLREGVTYVAADRIESADIFFDINRGLRPRLSERFDFAVLSGVLEYCDDPVDAIRRALVYGDRLIVSYAPAPDDKLARWGPSQIDREAFEDALQRHGGGVQHAHSWRGQDIYVVTRPGAPDAA